MKRSQISVVLSVVLGTFCQITDADVKPATIFQNNMVLQREIPVPVWGRAEPGEQVEVTFAGQTQKSTADKYGKWQIKLSPMKVSTQGLDMVLKGKNLIVLKNILVGDVWICGGQSNMEWSFRQGITDGEKHIKESAKYPLIRRVKINRNSSNDPVENAPIMYNWSVCGPKTLPSWSAAAYYFARKVHTETGIPIGLVENNVGGTPIVLFIAPSGFNTPETKPLWNVSKPFVYGTPEYQKRVTEDVAKYKAWLKEAEVALRDGLPVPALPAARHKPGSLSLYYYGMTAPVTRFPVKGAIWYQGCSDWRGHKGYYHNMHALVKSWREAWKQDIPFYYIQLASYMKSTNDPQGGNGYALLREAQRKAMDLPNSGMACAIDIGMENDIHPKNKFDAGERLALLALHDLYGKKDIIPSGPLFKSMEIKDGKAILTFDYAKGLMTAKKEGLAKPVPVKEKPAHFAIAGANKVWYWADAEIKGEQVILSSDKVKNPVAVRYAFRAYPKGVNMYNAAGLPMVPFRTDNW